jgi:hypothetical protein
VNDSWFKERYDPLMQYKWHLEKKNQSHNLAQKFVEFFIERGDQSCRGLSFDQDPSVDYERLGEKPKSISGASFYGFDSNSMTLYLKNIPVHISRWELLDVAKTTPGFLYLSMSEPLKAQNFERIAWLTYDSEESSQQAKLILETKSLNDYHFAPALNQGNRKTVTISPEFPEDNEERDLKKCERLITEVFDAEKEIQSTIQE